MELQSIGAEIYDDESERQGYILKWQKRYFPEVAFESPSTNTLGSQSMYPLNIKSIQQSNNDRQAVVTWSKSTRGAQSYHTYWAAYAEIKSEIGSSGDPPFQLARYLVVS